MNSQLNELQPCLSKRATTDHFSSLTHGVGANPDDVSRSIDEGKDESAQSRLLASLSHSHPRKHKLLFAESEGTAGKGTCRADKKRGGGEVPGKKKRTKK